MCYIKRVEYFEAGDVLPQGLKAQKRSILFQFDNSSFLVVDDELLQPETFEQAEQKMEHGCCRTPQPSSK